MWLFAKHGFFSIVEHRADPRNLLVRARVKGDIEHYFPDAKVTQTDDADYLYRAAETNVPDFVRSGTPTIAGFTVALTKASPPPLVSP
jgi:hypothetical protein